MDKRDRQAGIVLGLAALGLGVVAILCGWNSLRGMDWPF